MENKVLVTGLGNGILGDCAPCNYDAEQLICNPSMLLWIDKVLIPKKIFSTIEGRCIDPKDKIVQLIIEFFDKAKLVETVDTDHIFDQSAKTLLEKTVKSDIKLLTEINPELSNVGGDSHFIINYKGNNYCFPKILSLYGDLYLAKSTGANCLFSSDSIDFCQLKFGLTNKNPINTASTLSGVDKIISTVIPSIHSIPQFLSDNQECPHCANIEDCQKEYFQQLESVLSQYLEWRKYDEFYQLRDCINKIIKSSRKNNDVIMPDDIFDEFEQEKKRINSLIHRHLPKVKRFSNLITTISAPATIVSAVNGVDPSIIVASAALSGASTLTSVVTNHIEEKYKWVNFSLK